MPRLTPSESRRRFSHEPVARLATVDAAGSPHLVPITFVVVTRPDGGDVLYSAVDAKPKRSLALRRLANVAANPRVAVLADRYDDDWTALWWVRADGTARVLAGGTHGDEPGTADGESQAALELLAARYPQYRSQRPPGPVLAVEIRRWSGWAGTA